MTFQSTYTAEDVANRVKRTFGDESGVQVTNSDIIGWINSAQIEIASKNRPVRARAEIMSVANVSDYTLAADMNAQYFNSITYKGVKVKYMGLSDAQEYLLREDPNRLSRGEPLFWYEWAGTVSFYPTPQYSNESIVVYYHPTPSPVTALTDSLSLPDNYFNRIIDFVMAQAYEMDEQFNAMDAKKGYFDSALTEMGNDELSDSTDTYPVITIRPEDM